MEALLRPDIGLMFWTIFIFVLLVALLGRFAWKPLLHSLEERERRLRAEREAAEQARSAAEKLKSELEGRLSIIKEEAQSAMEAAFSDGAKSRDAIIEEAKQQAVGMIERAKREMEAEKQRLMGDMRREVSDLSVRAAEKILHRAIDPAVQRDALNDFLKELDKN